MYIPCHMTKMTVPIQGKKPSKVFSGTTEPIAMELDMLQLGPEYSYNIFINHDLDKF